MGASSRISDSELYSVTPSLFRRSLSKSDFKLARTCPAKLYFRENGYPDNREGNAYLRLLAEGGYMVEALAKARYRDGIQLEYGRDVAADFARTVEYLKRDEVTLFEATLLVGRRHARVDVLQKKGNTVRLLEVKSKSFDSVEHQACSNGAFRQNKPQARIRSEWREKLEDVTYQTLLLEEILPGVVVEPFLVLVDTSKRAGVDDVPGFFELVRSGDDASGRLRTARYTGTDEMLDRLDLVTEVDVAAEVALLRAEVDAAAKQFEERLDAPLAEHLVGVQRGAHCAKCEFRRDANGGTGGGDNRDGFADCWGPLAEAKPHMLELYSIGRTKGPDASPLVSWMVAQGRTGLLDIPLDVLEVKPDATPGGVVPRQRRQIEQTRIGEVWIGPALREHIASLHGPLRFIDFETSRLALPYHANMRPYGLIAFQWSCHTVSEPGFKPVHRGWLNDVDVWPNQSFAASLREEIGDSGPVLTWSPFEATTLKQTIPDLKRFGHDVPELEEWIDDVVEHRIVDLHNWARCDYYHPGMRGRTSIKVVLDAVWKSDAAMREQFVEWTGLPANADQDPYTSLSPVEIAGSLQDVHEGTGAMRAYQEMMYGADKHDPAVKAEWRKLLEQYCGLDTLSMVLIFEHWRRLVGLPG
jgi:hypothetical protein